MSRLLGVLGGMSWESSAVYYRLLNQGVAARRGGLHSAAVLLHSVDFAPVAAQQAEGRWDDAARALGEAAAGLRRAGAGALLLATNTMHRVADRIEAAGALPLLHIADPVGVALRTAGCRRPALLGTRYTMDDPAVLAQRLHQRHGLQVLRPDAEDRAWLHALIYDELCRGRVPAASRAALAALVGRQQRAGADAVILGCTELMLAVDADAPSPLPLFDSTALHAAAGVDWLLHGSVGEATA